MTSKLDDAQKQKILTPDVQKLLTALHGEARVVGGAVRDVILGRKIGDIDFATTLPPEKTTEILNAAGFKTVPTGFAHGTITAVMNGIGYEITTLRRDLETDGRHAKVAFTDNWQQDAARRDFTMNALYVDAEGNLFDYFKGVEDAEAGKVRFIGDARARVQEDFLRILRFFRIYAHFGKGDMDEGGLAACREFAALVQGLSIERVTNEFLKLLKADYPLTSLRLMKDCGVLTAFLPEATDLTRLQALLETEKKFGSCQEPLVRFSALLPMRENIVLGVAKKFKLSNRDTALLAVLATLPALLNGNLAPAHIRALVYRHGAEACRAAIYLHGGRISEALTLLASWKIPVFPLKGDDVVRLGVSAGPKIGETLRAVEEWWIKGDFKADRGACLKEASRHK